MANGIQLGFEIALGFVLFAVVCVVAILLIGLLIRIPAWSYEALTKELRKAFSPEGRKKLRTSSVHTLIGVALFAALLLVASLFSKH
jgi:hypothetical protein